MGDADQGTTQSSFDCREDTLIPDEGGRAHFLFRSALDALEANIAILDEAGRIVAVNRSWRRFADENGLAWPDYGVGRSYLSVIASETRWIEGREKTITAIRELLSGQHDRFSVEYPCHTPSQRRWYILRATLFEAGGRRWAIMAHEDITVRKLAKEALKAARASAELARDKEERERREAEARTDAALEALRDAEQTYRTIADFTYDWEYWERPDRTLRYVSPSCERITGYPPGWFLQDHHRIDELILAEDRPSWSEHRHGQRQEPGVVEFRIRRSDGSVRWIEHACEVVIGASGVFLGHRVSNRDVTARKQVEAELRTYREHLEELVQERTAELARINEALQAEVVEHRQTEEALRQSRERYALAQRAAHVGSWDWNIGTGALHWSEQIEPLFGFGQGEFAGTYEAFLACVHPEDRQYVIDSVQACVDEGQEYAIEHRIVWPDGTVHWVAETGDVIRDEGGQALRMLGIVQDICERKQGEETRSRLAAIVESSDDAIVGKTLEGTIVNWNAGAEKIYGYSAAQVVGRSVSILSPADRPDEVQRILDRIRRGERVDHFETERLRKDGTRIYVSLNISPIKDESGRVVGASTIARDITQRKQAEQALRAAKEAAEMAQTEERQRREESEQRRRMAESLGDVLAVLNSNRSLNDVLDYIAVQAGRLLGTRAAGIYSLESETGALAVRAARGLLVTYVAGANVPIGQTALRQAMASGQAVAIPDLAAALRLDGELASETKPPETGGIWTTLYRALLAVPIVIQKEVFGGMLLYYAEPRSFSDEEIELALAYGDQAALAIGNAQLREQLQVAAATSERDRLARELHDAVTQTLFSASLIAEALPHVWEHDPVEGRRGLEELRRLTRGAAAEMRTLLLELRPAALTEKPLEELLRHLSGAMTSRTRVPIVLSAERTGSLPPDVQIALYRIAQEALNNVAKYAGASEVSVGLCVEREQVILVVRDDGRGFDMDEVLPDQLGIGIMRERAMGIGASLEVASSPGQGTLVTVRWPNTGG
jgi:PAS domain S-box-containing protein